MCTEKWLEPCCQQLAELIHTWSLDIMWRWPSWPQKHVWNFLFRMELLASIQRTSVIFFSVLTCAWWEFNLSSRWLLIKSRVLICLLRLGVGVWPAESELEDFCFLFSLSWGCWLITGLPGSWSGTAHDSVLVSSSLTGELLNPSPVVPEFNLELLPFDLSWENGLMSACQSLPPKPYVSFRGFGSLRKKHFAWANLQHVHCMWKNTVTATEIIATVLLNLCKKQTQLCRDSSLLSSPWLHYDRTALLPGTSLLTFSLKRIPKECLRYSISSSPWPKKLNY